MTLPLIHPLIRPVMRLVGRDLRGTALAEAASAGLPGPHQDDTAVTEDGLDGLPEVVQRYLRFMGVVGRPRVWSFAAKFQGRFCLSGKSWMPAEAWQYNCVQPIGRVFHMRLDFARVVPMVGHDTYFDGEGRMVAKLLGVVRVANGSGTEFDISELTTWLNDALVVAPSMLLGPGTTWSGVDDNSFDVSLTHAGHTVTGRVSLDERGAMADFSSTDRWADLPGGLVRAEWTTPFDDWIVDRDHPLATHGQAIWHLDDGTMPYVEGGFVPDSVTYNVAP